MKETLESLKHKGFQLVCVSGKRNVLKQMSYQKYNVDVLSNSGKRKRKSVKTVAGNIIDLSEKEKKEMINEIALLVIN